MLALLILGAFVLIGPATYRALFPVDDQDRPRYLRAFVFLCVALAYTIVFGKLLPQLLGVSWSILTDAITLYTAPPLFWAGSWALGRDIEWEASLARAEARYQALARETQRAQLLALRTHLDPHFLFNTLNAIAEWCRDDPAVAERATLQLSAMLRTMLVGVKASSWPLARELELAQQLLELHHLRDPERFAFAVGTDPEAGAVLVPPLVLLPVVENAIKHGPAAGHGGTVSLRTRMQEGVLWVEVENPGAYAGPREGGEGIPMVRERLRLAYEGAAEMTLQTQDGATLARLRLPLSPLGGSA
jgi:LytS/YehU family sensor histidine kinase